MSTLRALRGSGWGRAALVALALAVALLLSGAIELAFYRPYGHGARAQVGSETLALRVTATSALHFVHLGAAAGFTLAVLAAVLLARPWRGGGPGRGKLALVVLVSAAFVATGLMIPWERLLPWSATMGPNMARPMPLGQQGPFAELVGVNARYDEAMFTVARLRLGTRATGRVFFAHVLVLPLLAVGAGVWLVRRGRRAPP
jgi:hypothetical protein